MNNTNQIKIFLVDDDVLFLKALEIEFKLNTEFIIETFNSGEKCLAQLSNHPDIIILDFQLNGIEDMAINGLETLIKIKEVDANIPVIMLSGQDKIEVAIQCMHNKAFDYVVKSETSFMRLKKIIETITQIKKMESELKWYMQRM